MAALDHHALQNELKKKRICRFCLSIDPISLTNIFFRDTRIKSSAPLPIQVMAIASIEIFSNDGMPPYVCSDCISLFEYSYQFKQMCKKADNLLRQYPLVGKWPKSLEKPTMPKALLTKSVLEQSNTTPQEQTKQKITQESLLLPKKTLNADAEDKLKVKNSVVDNKKCVSKIEKMNDEFSITYLEKIDNSDDLSIDDIQLLVATEEAETVDMEKLPVLVKPKLLNKSSLRILNKDAKSESKNRLSLTRDEKSEDNSMDIVPGIVNIDDKFEEEPNQESAEPIETNVFPCPHCERTFPLAQLRNLHLKKHFRDRNFPCSNCDKSFYSKYDLQRHSFTHDSEKPFKCSACDKAFSRSAILTRHLKTHTDIPKYTCVHCERVFISTEDLDRHAKIHSINRRFQCKICNKGFVFKQGLERHEVIHSSQQPFPCQYCDQSFPNAAKLTRHLTGHAGFRPYPCKYCKKAYLQSHHLKRHLRSHRNINVNMNAVDFMCTTCKTSFETRDKLIQHSKTHANEQNLTCPLCKEAFNNMNALTAHVQDHSEGEAYACEFCDLIFITAEKLQLHSDLDHSQEMEVYHADDRAQADKEKFTKEEIDVSDDNVDDLSDGGSDLKNQLKRKIKTEQETSPQIRDQSEAEQMVSDEIEYQVDGNNSLLIPLKQRKINATDKNFTTAQAKTVQQNKQSRQLKRKTLNAATPTKEVNQPTIQSLLKISEKRSSPPEQKTLSVAVKKEASPPPSSTKMAENQSRIKTIETNVKVQKIRVTKAEAAAMLRDGHIKIKDGKIILKRNTC